MKLKKLFFAVLMITFSAVTFAQQMPSIPVDPDVRIGKLDNGLTYYIRYNNWPENRAEFYIAQRVGSIQEEEEQRGLAHFLEHMCFNGTKHFPGNGIIRYCESIGVKFGADLNAYTSIDETVYNISNVPTKTPNAVDSCLIILSDWADGLLLETEEIDKERGVIHEEWRSRTTGMQRMLERNLPILYPDSKYGKRMPIGLMSVIDNFEPKFLRNYYETWYRPDNQAVIVVGDIDINYVENKIKELFGGIKMPENPKPLVAEEVPDNKEPIIIIDKDKEQRTTALMMMFKHEVIPNEAKTTLDYIVDNYLRGTATYLLNARLAECAQKAESPFVGAEAGDQNYLFAKTKGAFELNATPKEGQIEASLAAVYREALRAAEFGFTATEYERAKANTLSSLDKAYSNKDKRYNGQFCRQYQAHYLNNEPIPSIDFSYQTMKQMVPAIPLEAVNAMMKMLVPKTDSNLVVICFQNEKEGNTYPTREGILKALNDVRGEKLEAYVDNVKNEPIMTTLPQKGSIKKETENTTLGYKELTLSNGARVILKKTDFKKDQVVLQGEAVGGTSTYGSEDFANIKMFNDVIDASGLGNFSSTELQKALAGKIAGATISLSNTRVNVKGSSTPNDLETMLQLVYLYFTNINKDQESFDNIIKQYEIGLKNKAISPDAAFNDSVNVTVNNHNPRFASIELDDLKKVSYDRILEMAKAATANAGAFTFYILGNYDEATVRPLIEQYLASLPTTKQKTKVRNVFSQFKGETVNHFKRKMETPKANSVIMWRMDNVPYSFENSVRASMAAQVLSMIYLKKIREEASAAYSCGAQAGFYRNDFGTHAQITAFCPMKPEKADEAIGIMRDEMNNMAKTCDADMLTKVKEYMLKSLDDQMKTNAYWLNVIYGNVANKVDFHTNAKAVIEAQTPETISAFIAQLLKQGNTAEIVMLPEE
ncbi:MAG: M16 family metallopeptidase [Prevotella sp.]